MAGYERPDYWTLKAKKEGYPARSVYKLEEIVRKFGLLKGFGGRTGAGKEDSVRSSPSSGASGAGVPGPAILDVGAAPGSWSLWLLRQMKGAGRLVAVDIQDLGIAPADTNFRSSREVSWSIQCARAFAKRGHSTSWFPTPPQPQLATASSTKRARKS